MRKIEVVVPVIVNRVFVEYAVEFVLLEREMVTRALLYLPLDSVRKLKRTQPTMIGSSGMQSADLYLFRTVLSHTQTHPSACLVRRFQLRIRPVFALAVGAFEQIGL